jgi:hypothetical protein
VLYNKNYRYFQCELAVQLVPKKLFALVRINTGINRYRRQGRMPENGFGKIRKRERQGVEEVFSTSKTQCIVSCLAHTLVFVHFYLELVTVTRISHLAFRIHFCCVCVSPIVITVTRNVERGASEAKVSPAKQNLGKMASMKVVRTFLSSATTSTRIMPQSSYRWGCQSRFTSSYPGIAVARTTNSSISGMAEPPQAMIHPQQHPRRMFSSTMMTSGSTASAEELASLAGGIYLKTLVHENPYTDVVQYEHKNRVFTVKDVDYNSEALAIGIAENGLIPGDVVLSYLPQHFNEQVRVNLVAHTRTGGD